VVGLAFGDEGKGSAIDFFSRMLPTAVVGRFNGGPQAAHHVLTPGGREHVFAQFGSGLFVPGVKSQSLKAVYFDPLAALQEYHVLEGKGVRLAGRLHFSPECPIVTPFHQALGQLRELSRTHRHGSCGLGVGELFQDERAGSVVLRAGDLYRPDRRRLLGTIREHLKEKAMNLGSIDHPRARKAMDLFRDDLAFDYYISKIDEFLEMIDPPQRFPAPVIFEGAQGALLDRRYGFFPHVSVTDSTALHALNAYRLGIIRTIWTRHGPGPFPTEDERIVCPPDRYNGNNFWQGPVRHGWLDLVLLRYALSFLRIDALGLTCMDHAVDRDFFVNRAYQLPAGLTDAEEFFEINANGQAISIHQLPQSLMEQERLTKLLFHCRPVLEELPAPSRSGDVVEAPALVEYLFRETGKEVLFFSAGPTATGKTWRGPLIGT